MENAYGIGVKNRYELFYDDENDPLDILKSRERERERRKEAKLEKENKGKGTTQPKAKTSADPVTSTTTPEKVPKKPAKETPPPPAAKAAQDQPEPQTPPPPPPQPQPIPAKREESDSVKPPKTPVVEKNVKFNDVTQEEPHDIEEKNRKNQEDQGPNQLEFSERPDRSERGDRFDRGERGDRFDRSERNNRTERFERIGHSERSDTFFDRSDRGGRYERFDRPDRSDRGDRFERGGDLDQRGGDNEARRGGRGGFYRGTGFRGRGIRGAGRGGFGYDARGKREYDRQSGSDKSSVKQFDKRDGGGAHNWGSPKDYVEDQMHTSLSDDQQESADRPDNNVENGPPRDARGPFVSDDPEAKIVGEDAPREMTLDEWKREQEKSRTVPRYNLRKAGEGEDSSQWNKTYLLKKKEIPVETENAEDDDEEVVRRGRLKQVVTEIEIQFSDSRRSRGRGRGSRGGPGRGGRGRGEYIPRGSGQLGGGNSFREGGVVSSPGVGGHDVHNQMSSKLKSQSAPKVDDENDFPSLATA